jgi:hypothetical protein
VVWGGVGASLFAGGVVMNWCGRGRYIRRYQGWEKETATRVRNSDIVTRVRMDDVERKRGKTREGRIRGEVIELLARFFSRFQTPLTTPVLSLELLGKKLGEGCVGGGW